MLKFGYLTLKLLFQDKKHLNTKWRNIYHFPELDFLNKCFCLFELLHLLEVDSHMNQNKAQQQTRLSVFLQLDVSQPCHYQW